VGKGKINSQMKTVFDAFKERPLTMLMTSEVTGIRTSNICRYVAKWLKEGEIQLLEYTICEISKKNAGYYTTDRNLFK